MRKNKFEISIPTEKQENSTNSQQINTKESKIEEYRKSIKIQYKEIVNFKDTEINKDNIEDIEKVLLATENLMNNCIDDENYKSNKDPYFSRTNYVYSKILMKLETYKLEKEIEKMNNLTTNLQDRQTKIEEQSNNLIYNLLGFLTAFSIVSAVVETIGDMKQPLNVMIFITFTMLILLTTLIALHNFYKNDNKRETKLQDNYFLWKALGIILTILCIWLGITKIKDNKDKIFNYIDNKIEKVIEEKVEKEL